MSQNTKSKFPLRFSVIFSFLWLLTYTQANILMHQENLWSDLLFRATRESLKDGDPRIILLALDDQTGKELSFPVPRKYLAQMLDKLKALGVKTVSFDMLLMERREGDAELVAATKRFGRVIHLYHLQEAESEVGLINTIKVSDVPGLYAASQYIGYPNIQDVISEDGHPRHAQIFNPGLTDPGQKFEQAYSIDAATLASFTDTPLAELAKDFGGVRPLIFRLNFRKPVPRYDSEYEAARMLKLAEAAAKRNAARRAKNPGLDPRELEVVSRPFSTFESPYRRVSLVDVLKDRLTPEQRKALKGSLAMVGSTSLGYYDHYPSPFLSAAPGAEYHLNVIDNVINKDYKRDANPELIFLAILVLAWLPFFLQRLSPAASAAAAAGALVLWAAFCVWQFKSGTFYEFVTPAAGFMIAFLTLTVHRVLTEGQEKKFIKNLFGQFVAPEVVDDLARDPSKVKLGGEKKDMTMFFLDIAHFTTISEKMDPEKLLLFLNKYLSALSHVVHEQGGVVDKYIGDCIMAFWNAPLPMPDHRVRACLAAIDCQETIKKLNKDLDPTIGEVPAIRIGLNSGTVTVGLTGSDKKLQYTVIGDEVNLASRLEGANKFFGSRIMASESTYDGAKDVVEARELGKVRVVGKATPIKVFELLSRKGQLPPEWQKALPAYNRGLALFREGQYGDAVPHFEEVLRIIPKDGPSEFYLNTSRDYSAIPPDNWNGVINLTAK